MEQRTGWGQPALALAVGWLAGIAWQLQQAELWPDRIVGPAVAVATLLGSWAWLARRHRAGLLLLGIAALVVGCGSTSLRASLRLQDALSPALEGVDLVVTGVVAEMPQVDAQGTRFLFDVQAATCDGRAVKLPPLLSLGWWRRGDDDALLPEPAVDLRAGQLWRLTARLKAPHGMVNPHGFDSELWLFEQGIAATGSVHIGGERAAIAPPQWLAQGTGHPVERLRQTLRDAIVRQVADSSAAGVLAALAIGDQAAISHADWDLFRVTGVAHLMSISGLHVTMFAWVFGWLVDVAWRRSRRLPLWLPAPQAGRWGGLAAAIAYALLAGWGVPAQRTVAMIAMVTLLRTRGRRWPLSPVLLAAAVLVSALDPWALMQAGFWLSFVAVALLVASEPVTGAAAATPSHGSWRGRLGAAVRGGLRTQVVATIGLTPLTLVFFQQISIVGFIANLVAIPLVTLLVTPLALLGTVIGSTLPLLWAVDAALVRALMALLRELSSWPIATWTAAAAPAWAVASGLLGGALAIMPLPWRLRGLAVPLCLPLLAPVVARPAEGRFELVAADIGQGTAVLVRTRRHLLLFDTGPVWSSESNAGARVLLPLLRARGEHRVDLLVLSHRDSDHVGGAASVLAGLPVTAMATSLEAAHPLRHRGLPHWRCDVGQTWTWDGVRFDMLHPLAKDIERGLKPNAVSCVVRVSASPAQGRARGLSVLLTGDLEAPQEAAVIARAEHVSTDPTEQDAPDPLRTDVLIVPHHGSRTSSSAAFLDRVQPSIAVVQAAYRSRFGHPAPDVMARYARRGIAIVRSDRCGAWTLPADGTAWCEREISRRYWHHGLGL